MSEVSTAASAAVCILRFHTHALCGKVLALPAELNPYPNKPRLTFRPDGTFKITVFSDLHYGENAWDVWGPQQDVNSTKLMRLVVPDEKPDFV